MDNKQFGNLTLRRLRQSRWTRELTREVRPSLEQLIQPLFVTEGISERQAVPGLTGVYRDTEETLLRQIESDLESGVRKFLLFSVPGQKRERDFTHELATRVIRGVKSRFGDSLFLGIDVCLCSATSHGQCGIVGETGDHLENGATVVELARAALAYAQAGADCVAPSDMMDGRIGAIRSALDSAGLERTVLLSYAAKFHSRYYGPFRAAADSAPRPGAGRSRLKDRASYQIDPARPSDAYLSAKRDADEGADILMVKPALPYLDILADLSARIPLPWAAYEVSGEYAGRELLAREGLMDAPRAHVESWTSLVRAGASSIVTYGARRGRQWLAEMENYS